MPLPWSRKSRAHIEDAVWDAVRAGYPFASYLSEDAYGRLRRLCEAFLACKTISGAAGFVPTPLERAAIAFQACLPILELGLDGYDDFVEIIVYPDQFLVPRTRSDDFGIVHESTDILAGEAMDHGPVVLSWADIAPAAGDVLHTDELAVNVTIHEFVHKLDLVDGIADGVPALPPARRARWRDVLDRAYHDFCDELDAIEASIPSDMDPESEDADEYFLSLPLDAYAATDHAEFFAVSGEAFFMTPDVLAQWFPEWYEVLAAFFRQDPLRARGIPSEN